MIVSVSLLFRITNGPLLTLPEEDDTGKSANR